MVFPLFLKSADFKHVSAFWFTKNLFLVKPHYYFVSCFSESSTRFLTCGL